MVEQDRALLRVVECGEDAMSEQSPFLFPSGLSGPTAGLTQTQEFSPQRGGVQVRAVGTTGATSVLMMTP